MQLVGDGTQQRQGTVLSKNKKNAEVDFGPDDVQWLPLGNLEVVEPAHGTENGASAAAEPWPEPEVQPGPESPHNLGGD